MPLEKKAASTSSGADGNASAATLSGAVARVPGDDAAAAAGGVQVRPLVKHVLSKELQLFYEKCTQTIVECSATPKSDAALDVVLRSLRTDAGIQALLPYLVQFVADNVQKNMEKLALLQNLMKMVDSLLCNAHMNAEPYVR